MLAVRNSVQSYRVQCDWAFKPRTHDQVFLDEFSLDKFYLLVCTAYIDNFFLDNDPCSKAGHTSF